MLLQNLHGRLLSYLQIKLLTSIRKVGRWNNLRNTNPSQGEIVYDILNCGPRNRFVVFGNTPFVVSNCQSTGHDIHMLAIQILRRRLMESGLPYSWIIADFHDEFILETKEGNEERVKEIIKATEVEVNEILKPYVPLRLDPCVGKNLADFKVEG